MFGLNDILKWGLLRLSDVKALIHNVVGLAIAEHNTTGGDGEIGRVFFLRDGSAGWDIDIGVMDSNNRINLEGIAPWGTIYKGKWFKGDISAEYPYWIEKADGTVVCHFVMDDSENNHYKLSAVETPGDNNIVGGWSEKIWPEVHPQIFEKLKLKASLTSPDFNGTPTVNSYPLIQNLDKTGLTFVLGWGSTSVNYGLTVRGHRVLDTNGYIVAPIKNGSFSGTVPRYNSLPFVFDCGSQYGCFALGSDVYIAGICSGSIIITDSAAHAQDATKCISIGIYSTLGSYTNESYLSTLIGSYCEVAGYMNSAFGSFLNITPDKKNTTLIGSHDSAQIKNGVQLSGYSADSLKKARLAIWIDDFGVGWFGVMDNDLISGTSVGVRVPLEGFMGLLRSIPGCQDWLEDTASSYTSSYGF